MYINYNAYNIIYIYIGILKTKNSKLLGGVYSDDIKTNTTLKNNIRISEKNIDNPDQHFKDLITNIASSSNVKIKYNINSDIDYINNDYLNQECIKRFTGFHHHLNQTRYYQILIELYSSSLMFIILKE